MDSISIFWFRRDLRLHDNHGFFKALTLRKKVLPIFIFDTEILDKLPENDARVSFIHHRLQMMKVQLETQDFGLSIYYGKPIEVLKKLITQFKIANVFTNEDYEPYAIKRDKEISSFLKSKNIPFQSCKDHVIFEKDEIVKQDGNPYVVYTPYSKKWLENFPVEKNQSYPSEEHLHNCLSGIEFTNLSLKEIGFEKSSILIKDFIVNPKLIQEYESTRNFPSLDKTSRLGPHLRFGTVSIREIVNQATKEENITFLKELVWREFFTQILWHFPYTASKSFKPKYDKIIWRNNEQDFKTWCEGETGYPLVDAGMRQLNKTGFIHNRVRMLVGSFLCKHLLIDWRWGEAYFAEKLHDYEMASNIGNWQWVAGSGVDAAPYFRIFNPTTQIQKFDKNLEYIKKWVSDFREPTYPTPIVDHKLARERCLKIYKEALN